MPVYFKMEKKRNLRQSPLLPAAPGKRRRFPGRLSYALTAFAAAYLFFSCGIEEYPYLAQVPPSAVIRPESSAVRVHIPSRQESEFLYYSVFYRIYISEAQITSEIVESLMGNINASMQSDYVYIKPYTQADNNLAVNTGSIFQGRNFFEMEIEGAAMNDLLKDKGSFTLSFDFSDVLSKAPSVTKNSGGAYTLLRSTGKGLFSPKPLHPSNNTFDGRFVNTSGLNASDNATNTINRDVANKTVSQGLPRYTYVMVYLCATGINNSNLTPIYSAPTFIGAFLLPRQWWTGES